MKIEISHDDAKRMGVDRSGSKPMPDANEGFVVYFGDTSIHFEDEADALTLAEMIVNRLGYEVAYGAQS